MQKILSVILAAALLLLCGCTPDPVVSDSSVTSSPSSDVTSSNATGLQVNTDIPALKDAVVSYAARNGIGEDVDIRINITVEQKETENYTIVYGTEDVSITADCETAAYYAAQDVCNQLLSVGVDGLTEKTVSDGPTFPVRGVIEGFYGTPWTHEYRLSLMEFLGDMKMNTYMYAPKDDQKHLKKWREAYTDEEKATMKELVDAAKANYVDFIYAISPGNDIKLGDGYEEDFEILVNKLQSVYDLGVRHFAILFDDISSKDAVGHTKLLNDFQKRFVETHEGVANLITVSNEYSDVFYSPEYSDAFGELLDEDIEVMWTGEAIVPGSVTNQNLQLAQRLFDRKVIIWWNYPCNDFDHYQLYMGAAENLDPDLAQTSTGFLSNPMNQGVASKVPLYTLSQYLWDPASYDPDQSLTEACLYMANGDQTVADALRFFVDHTKASTTNGYTESDFYQSYIDAFDLMDALVDTKKAVEDFQKLIDAVDILQNMDNRELVNEINGWLAKLKCYGKLGVAFYSMVELENEGASSDDIKAKRDECKQLLKALDASAYSAGAGTLFPLRSKIELYLNNVGHGDLIDCTVTSNMETYAHYDPAYACDDDITTWYWGKEPVKGHYVELDLWRVQTVNSIRVIMGAEGHEKDYFYKAILQYSVDGENWNNLSRVSSPTTGIGDLDIECRYIRLVCEANQNEWLTLMEFNAYT